MSACGDDDVPDAGMDDGGRDAGDGGPPPEAMLTIAPIMQDFGDVVVGAASAAVDFTVTNAGTGDSATLQNTISGDSSFSVSASTCAGLTLAPAATCTISVVFEPTDGGAAGATLMVTDGTASAAATLEANGLDGPGLAISPTPHNFGPRTVGAASETQTFTVTNVGDDASGTIAISLGGTDATQFMLGADTCTGMTLAAGATCTVEVVYMPTSAGSHMATLDATASPGGTSSAALSGTANLPPALYLAPGVAGFGSVVAGSSSAAPVVFMLTNTGGTPTAAIMPPTFGGTDGSEFSVTTTTCGAPLASGASCTINVSFTAGAPGPKTASLDVTDGTLTASASLTATSLAPGSLVIEPATHDYGTSPIGTSTPARTFTVRNTGGSPSGALSVAIAGGSPSDFPIDVPGGDGCTGVALAAGGTCTVAIRFRPEAAGLRGATLRVTGTPGGAPTADLSGTGAAPASLTLMPTAADFGSVATGASSTVVNFTVTNTGSATSGLPMVNLRGPQSTQWRVAANGCTAALTGGATCMIGLVFEPTTTGTKVAQLEVAATPGGTLLSDIVGLGITPANLGLSPTTANFGNVAETDSADRTIIVQNTGMATVTALSSGLSGPDAAQFSILPSSTCGATLAGMSSCNIDVRFAPSGQGARMATLSVMGTPGGTVTAALGGTGIPDLLLEPNVVGETFDYGDVIIGNTLTRVFRVTNQTVRGLTSVTITSPPATGTPQFLRTATTCGATLASGASCTVTIRFQPTGTSGSRMVDFTVTGSGGATETQRLTGDAAGPVRFTQWQLTTPPGATSTTFPAAFGSRAIGGIYEVTLTAQNTGTLASGTISTAPSFTGDLNIVGDDCSGANLAAGATCTVVVRFYPQTVGAAMGTITLSYGTNSTVGNVTANGVTGASIGVTGSGDFGTVIATQTADRTFTVTNASATESTGNISYSLTGSARYAITGGGSCAASGTAPLAGGGSCTIVVRFSPSQADVTTAALTGTLVVQQGAQTRNTALTGRASSQLTLSPATHAFTTAVGSTSATRTFTVRNVGTTATGSIVVGTAGPGTPSEFPVTANTCTTLAAGATCTFDVAFAPTADIDRSGVEIRASNGVYVAGSARTAVSTVSGNAQSNANLVVDPSGPFIGSGGSFFFGDVAEGTNGPAFTFTVRNTGDLASGSLTASIVPAAVAGCGGAGPWNTTDFWDITSTTCTGSLASGGSCTVAIRHSPPPGSACGGFTLRSASWRVTDGATTLTTPMSAYSNTLDAVFPTPAQSVFASTVVGSMSGAQTIMVTNSGASSRTITTAPSSSTNYTVSANTCTVGVVLMAGGSCTFSLRFTPTSAGFKQEIISVNAGSIVMFHVANGTALAAAGLTLTPSGTVTYPSTTSGTASARAFTVANPGGVPTAATPTPSLGGADPGQFAIVRNMCTAPLAGGGSCTFEVEFRPTGAGSRSATLTVGAGGGLTAGASLSGTGIAAALLGITPSAPQSCAPNHAGNDVYACVSYTVSNGGGSSAPLGLGVTGDFRIGAASTCAGANLAPGSMCTVAVEHTPAGVGGDAGTLTVSSPGIASVNGTISSSGIEALERTAGSPAFGSTAVGGAGVTRTFTITNQANPATGILTYAVAGTHAADFDVTGDTCSGGTLADGGACTVSVRFLPSVASARDATLTVSDGSANKTEVIAMSGSGT